VCVCDSSTEILSHVKKKVWIFLPIFSFSSFHSKHVYHHCLQEIVPT
jgi:hypothetical protein